MRKDTKIVLGIISIISFFVMFSVVTIIMSKINKENKAQKYSKCYVIANQKYLDDWNTECKALGRADDCRLEMEMATRLDASLERSNDYCIIYAGY